ncbi:MAG TPA: Fe-Mn family superoxide dismutase [Nitrospirota bacterium]|nr:Fe-Mn family superoxide dismutase [Nitrospirota bacterium]
MHQAKEFKLEGKLKGISDNQLQQHRDTLYAGYVAKLNLIEDEIKKASTEGTNPTYSVLGELKRQEIFATNGVFLHEAYFGNLGGKGGAAAGKIGEMIKERWGSFEKWLADFRAAGMAARGWVVLAFSFNDMSLHNYSMDVHDKGSVCNTAILLVMDVYEHAYMIDYGVKRAAYLDAFFQNIDWDVVNERVKYVTGGGAM